MMQMPPEVRHSACWCLAPSFTRCYTLQVCKVQQYPFTDDQAVMQADWELYIQVHC